MIIVGFLAVVLLLAANAFFVAAEFSLVAVDRTRLAQRAEAGSRSASVAQGILARLSYSLSGAQLGITICSLALGVLSEPVVAVALEPLVGQILEGRRAVAVSVALALAITTVAQIVVGELVPKSVAVARPLNTALRVAPAFQAFSTVFKPMIAFSNSLADKLVGLVGIELGDDLERVHSRRDLQRLVESSEKGGAIRRSDAELLQRTFRFAEKTAADALKPRMSVRALPSSGTVEDLIELSHESGFSRFPVIGEDLDDVLGVVHIKDVLGLNLIGRRAAPLDTLIRPILAVPETKELESLMLELQRADGQFALVVDEYGGTAGIVTLEDLIEEIVGDISDEHDQMGDTPAVRRWTGVQLVPGLLHPDEVFEAAGFVVPEGDYETLGGFVVQRLGSIPKVAQSFVEQGWTVAVEEMDGRRVSTVKLIAPLPGTISGPVDEAR